MEAHLPQRLAAILAADVAGYTRLMELDEADTVAAWRQARSEVIDPTVERYSGRIVKLTGDGFLAEFPTIESAVRAALAMQQALGELFAGRPAERRFAFRMGVNLGDIWVDAEDVYGAGVNVAARLESLAPAGGLCISDAVHEAVGHKVPARYEDLGPRRVKNVATPVHVWRVHVSASASVPRVAWPVRAAAGASRPVVRRAAWAAVTVALAVAAVMLRVDSWRAANGPANERVRPTAVGIGADAVAPTAPATAGAVAEPAVPPDSIAVLPFLNIDGSEETRIFGDGLAEDVISRLAGTPPLRVSSRGDSFALGPNSPSEEVRRRLRVSYYLQGSVRRSGERLRVAARLIDSATGYYVESRTFDKSIGEFGQLQDELTDLIVATLRAALPSLAGAPVPALPETESFDAYLAYRRGMDVLQRPMSPAAAERALAAFRRSLSIDPDYAAAFAGICLTYTAAYDVTLETAYIAEAERSCAAALERSPNLIVVHDALGELYLRTGRHADAQAAFERALRINASDVPALTGLAAAHLHQGRPHEAEAHYRKAVGLQPGNWRTYNELGKFLYASGRYAEAAEAYREVVAVEPGNATGWGNLASSLMLGGDFAGAAHAFERALEAEPSARTLMNLGMMHYYLGDAGAAREALERAIAMAPQDYLAWSNLGDVLALAGDVDGSEQAFRKAEQLAREQLPVNSRDPGRLIDLAWITAMLGRLDEARRLIDSALALAPADPYVHYYDALVRVRAGEIDAALDRLEKAVEMGYSRAMIGAEPHLASLRERERFVRLVGESR
ncbi:MAG TPA: tetratricopeptide repeat protein [Gammaproteobacteria bacterium]